MAEKEGGRGAVFGMFVAQAIGATGSPSYVIPFPTTASVMELDVRLHRRVIIRRAARPRPDAGCPAERLLKTTGHIALICGRGIECGYLKACCDG